MPGLTLLVCCLLPILRISAQPTVVTSLYSVLRPGWCEGASVDSITPEEIYCVQASTCCGANFVVSRIHTVNGSILANYSLQGQYSGTTPITTSIDRFSSQMWVISGDRDSAIISITLGNGWVTYVDAFFIEETLIVGASKLIFDVGFLQGYWFYILTASPQRVAVCSHLNTVYQYDLPAPHNLSHTFAPVDMAYDGGTGLYVLDSINGVVVVYNTPTNTVTRTLNVSRDGPTQLGTPSNLAVDGFGNVFVSHVNSNAEHNFIAVYDPLGNLTYQLYSVPNLQSYQLLVDTTPSLVISNVATSAAQPYGLVRLTNLPDAPYLSPVSSPLPYFLLPMSTAKWASSSTSTQCPTLLIQLTGLRLEGATSAQTVLRWWADNGTEITAGVVSTVLSGSSTNLNVCVSSFYTAYLAEGLPSNTRTVSVSVQVAVISSAGTFSLHSNIIPVAMVRADLSVADESMRYRLLLWSFISYGGYGAQLNTRWDCSLCPMFAADTEVTSRAVFNSDLYHSFAVMGYTTLTASSLAWRASASSPAFPLALNHAIVVAFRGTDFNFLWAVQDGLTDADAYPVLLGNDLCPVCTFVRQGFFLKAMGLIISNGLGAAFMALLHANPTANIIIAGHSLGGALASQFAMWVIDYLHGAGLFQAQVALYTYGQPPVGDASYVQCLQANLPAIHRQIHYQDPVPNAFIYSALATALLVAVAIAETPLLAPALLQCPQLVNVNAHTDVTYCYTESLGDMQLLPYPSHPLQQVSCALASITACQGNTSFSHF